MVSIIRALADAPGIPAAFPILLDADMAIIESAFVWLMERAELSGRAQASETWRHVPHRDCAMSRDCGEPLPSLDLAP